MSNYDVNICMKDKDSSDLAEKNILVCAKKIFARDGFEKASMSAIANEASISRTSLNYYFRTKDRLFAAVFKSLVSSFFPNINVILNEKISFDKKIDKIIDAHLDVLLENKEIPAFVIRQLNDSKDKFLSPLLKFLEEDGTLVCLNLQVAKAYKLDIQKVKELFLLYAGLMVTPFLLLPVLEGSNGDELTSLLLSRKKFISKTIKRFLKEK